MKMRTSPALNQFLRLISHAKRLKRDGDWKAASLVYTHGIERYPDFNSLYRGRADCRLALDDVVGAIDDLKRAADIHPEQAAPHIWLGDICLERGRYNSAVQAYSAALKARHSDRLLFMKRGQAYLGQGQKRAGMVDLARTLAFVRHRLYFTRDDVSMLYYLARTLELLGRDSESDLAYADFLGEANKCPASYPKWISHAQQRLGQGWW